MSGAQLLWVVYSGKPARRRACSCAREGGQPTSWLSLLVSPVPYLRLHDAVAQLLHAAIRRQVPRVLRQAIEHAATACAQWCKLLVKL